MQNADERKLRAETSGHIGLETQPGIAIIPARGGSKRIPRKNLRPFLGVPIIGRVIQTLIDSALFTEIIVSTEDSEIAQVAQSYGASVPFRRPANLATDYTTTAAVVNHAIDWLRTSGNHFPHKFMVAYPTSVMMTVEHIWLSHNFFVQSGSHFVFTGARFPSEILRSWRRTADGLAIPNFPRYQASRSQDHEPAYFDAGQLYWATQKGWRQQEKQIFAGSQLFEVAIDEAIDINTEDDWNRAERAFVLRGNPDESPPLFRS